MTDILFYHLEQAKLETILPALLLKCLERDWQCLIRVGAITPKHTNIQQAEDGAHIAFRLDALDEFLWSYDPESFLPHGAFDPHADENEQTQARKQPVWITPSAKSVDHRDILFLVDGAPLNIEEIGNYSRVMKIFDGGEEEDINAARALWKDIKATDFEATYWQQGQGGRWEKKA